MDITSFLAAARSGSPVLPNIQISGINPALFTCTHLDGTGVYHMGDNVFLPSSGLGDNAILPRPIYLTDASYRSIQPHLSPAAGGWDVALSTTVTRSATRQSLADFDKAGTHPLRNYMFGAYVSQLEIPLDAFKMVWNFADKNNPPLRDALSFVARASVPAMGDWNPYGTSGLVDGAQRDHRKATNSDAYPYAEVICALMNGISNVYGKIARWSVAYPTAGGIPAPIAPPMPMGGGNAHPQPAAPGSPYGHPAAPPPGAFPPGVPNMQPPGQFVLPQPGTPITQPPAQHLPPQQPTYAQQPAFNAQPRTPQQLMGAPGQPVYGVPGAYPGNAQPMPPPAQHPVPAAGWNVATN